MAEQLAADPPLAFWAAITAAQRARLEPKSLSDLARWLAENALDVLSAAPQRERCSSPWQDHDAERFADQVEADLLVAEVAALLAASQGESLAHKAYLAGLIHGGRRWLLLVGSEEDIAAGNLFDGLAAFSTPSASRYVTEAVAILAGERSGESVATGLAACRQRAAERRGRWLEPIALAGCLPALVQKLRRLGQLERQFQQTLETEKLAAMAEFAAGAGHEINNPLAVIGGRAQLFLRQETDPERRRELALMNAQVKRAYEMIADMRLFARPPKPEPQQFDLVALVDRVLADMASQAADRAISLARSGDPSPVHIEADPAQIHVALRALASNSLEAIGHGGRVEIAIHRAGDNVRIQVLDDGPGILPEHRRHIFDPFYSARQAGRGLGLGLSKCWRIVTGHGGRIEVESQPGRGAAFAITLPCRMPHDERGDSLHP